jgi:hypothetical protein
MALSTEQRAARVERRLQRVDELLRAAAARQLDPLKLIARGVADYDRRKHRAATLLQLPRTTAGRTQG